MIIMGTLARRRGGGPDTLGTPPVLDEQKV
jgi:hypothetical protein